MRTNKHVALMMLGTAVATLSVTAAVGPVSAGDQAQAEARAGEGETPLVATPTDMNQAAHVLRAKVLRVGHSTSAHPGPPMTKPSVTWTIVQLEVLEVYRGNAVTKKQIDLKIPGLGHSEKSVADCFEKARQARQEVVVIMEMLSDSHFQHSKMYIASDDVGRQAEAIAKLPVCWTSDGEHVVSPWGAAEGAYPAKEIKGIKCSKSGRPAFLAPPGVSLKAKRAENQTSNGRFKRRGEYGVGVFHEITLTNTTNAPQTVEALRSKDGRILWDESILYINDEKVWLPLGFAGFTPDTEATVLQPGQEVTTTMLLSSQYGVYTYICLGNLAVRVGEEGDRWFESFVKRFGHTLPPFQQRQSVIELAPEGK